VQRRGPMARLRNITLTAAASLDCCWRVECARHSEPRVPFAFVVAATVPCRPLRIQDSQVLTIRGRQRQRHVAIPSRLTASIQGRFALLVFSHYENTTG